MSRIKEALEKAKVERTDPGLSGGLEDADAGASVPSPPSGAARQTASEPSLPARARQIRAEINPSYSETLVRPVDRRVLAENLIHASDHGHILADRYKLLRTQVMSLLTEWHGNTVLVTSAQDGEGKTTTAVNLAISVSHEMDRTVLLVDADLKTPSVQRIFGLEGRPGLSDYLLRQSELPDVLVNPGIPRLVILPGGRPLDISAELLGSPRMEALMEEVKARYPERLIILDAPSLLACADPLVLSRYVDGILLVVESERTTREDLAHAMDLVRGKPILGTVFNKADET